MNFVVHSYGFGITCGGSNVTYVLARELSRFYPTRIYCSMNKREPNHIFSDYISLNEINDESIAIYPQITKGNPLKCKRVIRWMLFGSHIHETYDDSDITYYFAPFSKNLTNIKNKLCCFYLPDNINNKNIPKVYYGCYIFKKGLDFEKNVKRLETGSIGFKSLQKSDIGMKLKASLIDILGKSHTEVVEIFNRTKYFFCYDHCTFLIYIALLCGCVVIQQPIDGYTKEEWMYAVNIPPELGGISYGEDDVVNAEKTINNASEVILRHIEVTKLTIENFVKDCERMSYSTEKCYEYNNDKSSFQHQCLIKSNAVFF